MIALNSFLVSFCVYFSCVSAQNSKVPQFKVIKEWEYINFTWPSYDDYMDAVHNGNYVPQDIIIAGVTYYESSFYLSLPRMKAGVPATVAKISQNGEPTPLLKPFPNWDMNKIGECSAIQNTQNLAVDTKGKMWIVDSGRVETLSETPRNLCKPKLLVWDLLENKTVLTYTFPEEVAGNHTYPYDLVIDESDGGFVYITDNSAKDPGIIVYCMKTNSSWKLRHPSMKADPGAVGFKVDGIRVQNPINLAGIALGPVVQKENGSLVINEDRQVYFSPISSINLFAIKTSALKNQSNGEGEFKGEVLNVGNKASQTDGMIMDDTGVLYYGLLGDSSVAKWDSKLPFASGQKVISRDAVYIQWPNSFAFDLSGNLFLLTNRLQKFIYDRINLREPNFRLLSAHVGTKSYLYRDRDLEYDTSKAEEEKDELDEDEDDEGDSKKNENTTTATSISGGSQDSASLDGEVPHLNRTLNIDNKTGLDRQEIGSLSTTERVSEISSTSSATQSSPSEMKISSSTAQSVSSTTAQSASSTTQANPTAENNSSATPRTPDDVNDEGATVFAKKKFAQESRDKSASSKITTSFLLLLGLIFFSYCFSL